MPNPPQPLHYSAERNVQILVALLKAHGVRTVVVSPGTTNICFVWSVQQDCDFRLFSAADERQAAYLACGLATESGEPVAITCTGATASRNYLPALTEAYYRKVPVLAITATQTTTRIGNLVPQLLDRTSLPKDAVRFSLQCPIPKDAEAERACVLGVNRALIELRRHGGGPVHINLETYYTRDFSVRELPSVRVIRHHTLETKAWPSLEGRKVGVWIGAHRTFSQEETTALERFVRAYDAVVFVDGTSGYQGLGAFRGALAFSQGGIGRHLREQNLLPEVLIHIGEVSGDYPQETVGGAQEVWRVNPDGEVRDLFGKLTHVFEMEERTFFDHCTEGRPQGEAVWVKAWHCLDAEIRSQMPELPFSNPWMAQQLTPRLPKGSCLHLGILNSLRSWNLFPPPKGVEGAANVGGFGIDGCLSTALGAALAAPDKRVFLVLGDLAFFYDMNALGNRHLGRNLRILLVNNASGGEFHLYNHPAYQFGEAAGDYIAADGHYGNKSRELVRHYAEDLGLTYLFADDKASFEAQREIFLGDSETSILLECFTSPEDESEAHRLLNRIIPAPGASLLHRVASKTLPKGVKQTLRKAFS